jgi:hypothetical protein
MFYKAAANVKVDAEGIGEAVFATLNVVDKDGDLTVPGAFGNQTAKISPAHDWGAPGMGLAEISESGDAAVAKLTFNMEMRSAKEWAESLKFNHAKGIDQEWSYGFDIEDASDETRDGETIRVLKKLKVYEVSPVMVGAGIDTRTRRMKSGKGRTLEAHFADVVSQNKDFADRLADLKSKREQERRSLSQANRERLKQLVDELSEITKAAGELIVVPDDGLLVELLQHDLTRTLDEREQICH